MIPAGALSAPSALRNREPIGEVLKAWLPEAGEVVEIAAGTGEHALYFAAAFPNLVWRPTDPDETARASIAAWREAEGTPNLRPPALLDAADPASWPISRADGIVCINMIHISPWASTEGLMAGADKILPPGGILYLYGPYLEPGVETVPSNLAFDADLKRRNPAWGLRDLDVVKALATQHGLEFAARVAMPANNLSVVFRKRG
jgi:hypothetical protein